MGTYNFTAFPLILPWRPEFWTLPLYFPGLQVGVLWHWPREFPWRGRELPPEVRNAAPELRHYAPGELRQWRAFEEYRGHGEELDDLVRALKGEPAPPPPPEGPWQTEKILNLAWQLELMEAEQETHLVRVEEDQRGLSQLLAVEPWEEAAAYAAGADLEVVDPESAALRYRLWRRELNPRDDDLPFLLGRSAAAVFISRRRASGGGEPRRVRLRLPGCRSAELFQELRGEGTAPRWQEEFAAYLIPCLERAARGEEPGEALSRLEQWVSADLAAQWPEPPPFTWELELWLRDPDAREGGQALLAWGGLGPGVVAG